MRLLGALIVGIITYAAVPLLWQHMVVSKVVQMEKGPPPIPVSEPIASVDTNNLVTQINPPVVIDTKKYEAIAVQSQVDQAIARSQAAQDQAMHGYDPGRN